MNQSKMFLFSANPFSLQRRPISVHCLVHCISMVALFRLDASSKNKMKRIQLYSYSSQKRTESSESPELNESIDQQSKSKSARIQPQSPSKSKRNATSSKASNQKSKNTQNQGESQNPNSNSNSNSKLNQTQNQNQNQNQTLINMDKAKEHLMLSFVPEHILCREAERADIYNYLHNSILQKGNGSPLYISGPFSTV